MNPQIKSAMERKGWIVGPNDNTLLPDEGKSDVYALVSNAGIEFGSATVHVGHTIVIDNPEDAMTPTLARQVFEKIAAAYYTPPLNADAESDDDWGEDWDEFESQFALPG